jgi:hypothetical protein
MKFLYESAKFAQENQKQYELYGRIFIHIENPLPNTVSIKQVIKNIEEKLPEHILYDVDSIYVGNFQALNDREVDSIYISGTILIKNNIPNNQELYKTLVHEFAHAVEEASKDVIYGDGEVADELLRKRKYLFSIIKDDYDIDKKVFFNLNYTEQLDKFFYKEIGYDNMHVLTANLFLSPYGCTSLREYFANGFEFYFNDKQQDVRKISPAVFRKIKDIITNQPL